MAGGEDFLRARRLAMAKVHLYPCCPSSALLGGRDRQGQRGQEPGTAAGCQQQVRRRWGGREGGKCLGEDGSDKGKVWMC